MKVFQDVCTYIHISITARSNHATMAWGYVYCLYYVIPTYYAKPGMYVGACPVSEDGKWLPYVIKIKMVP